MIILKITLYTYVRPRLGRIEHVNPEVILVERKQKIQMVLVELRKK